MVSKSGGYLFDSLLISNTLKGFFAPQQGIVRLTKKIAALHDG